MRQYTVNCFSSMFEGPMPVADGTTCEEDSRNKCHN